MLTTDVAVTAAPKIYCPELRQSFDPWWSVPELARFRGLHEQSIYRRIRRGDIPGVVHEGAKILISTAAVLTSLGLTVQRFDSASGIERDSEPKALVAAGSSDRSSEVPRPYGVPPTSRTR